MDGPAVVLVNVSEGTSHWVGVRLTGTRSNRDGIGASVELTTARGKTQYATVTTTGSYLSASDRTVHFGLGEETAGSIRVRWPSGAVQDVPVTADRVMQVTEPASSATAPPE